MRSFIGLVAVLCLASGLIGAFAVNGLSGEAGAAPGCPPKCPTPSPTASPTPAPPQQREDQIEIFWTGGGYQIGAVQYSPLGAPYAIPAKVALDPADYPPSSVFRLEAILWVQQSPDSVCLRLFDMATNTAVPASEVCTNATGAYVRVRSPVFSLPSGEHEYALEGRCSGDNPFTGGCGNSTFAPSARIIAEWTERR